MSGIQPTVIAYSPPPVHMTSIVKRQQEVDEWKLNGSQGRSLTDAVLETMQY